ncbi:genetic competence negative regulator [Ornithinibacillus gellani]|uniref:genetic competence negative regulator n=1 Tax=Ornithinibacillus gellani TaxID=2293253 RepID=UPI000F47CF7A|nr:genetic competence negative regulator [Ornithinibacillus gellani]TQS74436.1 genetic competence negative regulator [Ornithinibacillus gellani]
MRIERLSKDQFTIFLTFDDLVDRGFTKEDLWYDVNGIQNLFSDMMYEASDELGFELEGKLIVQVHLMQAQGMHVTVTQKLDELDVEEDYIEMKVTLDESKELMFSFHDFEYVIQVAACLETMQLQGGSVYHMDERYYMLLEEADFPSKNKDDIIAVMSEYGSPSIITSHRLKEYGKVIMDANAVKQINSFF